MGSSSHSKPSKKIERTFANAPEIRISRIENQILFADAHTTLTTQLMDAKYPEYDSVIPESFEGHVVVSKASIMDTTRDIFVRAHPKNALVCLEINPQQIRISAKTSETDEIHETLAGGVWHWERPYRYQCSDANRDTLTY